MTKKLSLFAMLLAAKTACAYDLPMEEKKRGLEENGFVLSLGGVSFDRDVAAEEGVEDTALYMKFGWEGRYYNNVILGLGFAAFGYSDNDSFNQWTEDTWGDEEYTSSSAAALNYYGELGYGFELAPEVSLDLIVGMETVLSSERSINNCSDCYSEDIDIESGRYFSPRIRIKPWTHWSFAFSYRTYFNGHVENNAHLSAGFIF
ncbi:hypothetical protein TDB9533_01098 [Thalassocella blandensis]|nr:hypothetical protein TDB9533_01098 [Thalassocella blandensis]